MGYYNNHVEHGAHSSVVERRFVVPKVEGSIPSGHPLIKTKRRMQCMRRFVFCAGLCKTMDSHLSLANKRKEASMWFELGNYYDELQNGLVSDISDWVDGAVMLIIVLIVLFLWMH